MTYPTYKELRSLNPEVFEKAAEYIKTGENTFSCDAVDSAEADFHTDVWKFQDYGHKKAYAAVFGPKTPEDKIKHPFWNKGLTELSSRYGHIPDRTMRRWKSERIMALAMMAAIVRAAKR